MLKLKLQYLAAWRKQLTHWKRLWCWERLKAEGEEWDGWWYHRANSGRRWGTGKPGMLQSMRSLRVRHDLATEQQQRKFTIYLQYINYKFINLKFIDLQVDLLLTNKPFHFYSQSHGKARMTYLWMLTHWGCNPCLNYHHLATD